MNNTNIIFENINMSDFGVSFEIDEVKIKLKNTIFDAKTINKLLANLKFIKNKKQVSLVTIYSNAESFLDDATVSVFEIILYNTLKYYCKKIKLVFKNLSNKHFNYEFYKNSLIYNKIILDNEYIKEIEKGKIIKFNHFVTITKENENDRKKNSILYTEISTFLKPHNIELEYSDMISETIAEIIDNANSHAHGDCMAQIKIFDIKSRKNKKFKLLNIVVLNLSEEKLGSKLKEKIISNDIISQNKIVKDAYNNHIDSFNDNYDIDMFSMLSTFQKYVTTRENSSGSGGTGLTTLIKSLIGRTYENYCYVKSGKNSLFFKDKYLYLNDDGTIGFNENNNYIKEIPNSENMKKNDMDFNGTIYNLTLILEGD